jgi:hypothetical protein
MDPETSDPFPLMLLPLEIRYQIYEYMHMIKPKRIRCRSDPPDRRFVTEFDIYLKAWGDIGSNEQILLKKHGDEVVCTDDKRVFLKFSPGDTVESVILRGARGNDSILFLLVGSVGQGPYPNEH